MKKFKILSIIIFVIILIVLCIMLLKNMNKSYRPILDNENKKIIAEKAYKNFAWGFQYSGMAIFNDGTIYEWNFKNNKLDYKAESFEEHSKWILEHSTILSKRVTESDLNEFEKNINILENSIDTTNTSNDAGSNYISVWDKNNAEIKLKESGDFTGENKTMSAQKLISIINKYLQ